MTMCTTRCTFNAKKLCIQCAKKCTLECTLQCALNVHQNVHYNVHCTCELWNAHFTLQFEQHDVHLMHKNLAFNVPKIVH
jgi:hypothetical protein